MVKDKRRPDFEFANEKVRAGERYTFNLEVPDLYTHTGLSIPVHVVHGKRAGPVLFLSGAVHGDEINGVEIIRRVLESPRLAAMNGTLLAVPVVNIFGFLNQVRYLPDRRDLNRSFPGSDSGSLARRMADLFVTQIVARCTHGIDIHTAAIHRDNLPQIRAVLDDPETEQMARAFELPVILNTQIIGGSLRETAEKYGVQVLVYEAGEALRFDEWSIQCGVRGIISVMQSIGMLRKRAPRRKVKPPFVAQRSIWIRAPQSGIHRTLLTLGAEVRKGQVLGYISDPLGYHETAVISTTEGIVIGRTTIPLITEGEALFHIASFEESTSEIAEVLDASLQQASDVELRPSQKRTL
ncbi:MAG: succinylglutamate desuccinylase/aspartoacylase family protein [Proteobacteria bacterium]|nr:succinylglutamate desuccinylase/aspartoacylase family protein [Pseudomonadota bacterium]